MRAGRLRFRVKILQAKETQNAHGGVSLSWAVADVQTLATRWADVLDSRGREFQLAAATRSDITHVLKMRYYSPLTTKHRIELEGRALEVEAVTNQQNRKREMLVSCKEVV